MLRPSVQFEEDVGVSTTGPVPTGSTQSPRPCPKGSRVLLGPAWEAPRGARPHMVALRGPLCTQPGAGMASSARPRVPPQMASPLHGEAPHRGCQTLVSPGEGGGVLPGSPEDRGPHSPLLSRSPCPPRPARLTRWPGCWDGFAKVKRVSSRSDQLGGEDDVLCPEPPERCRVTQVENWPCSGTYQSLGGPT